MTLSPGARLGPYEVLAPLGAGGMGEVYRARDTRLGREVAVKVLPRHLSESAEARARFEREARTVSALQHPHICVLHDVGREGGTDYLVMELADGETLAHRLTRGPLPIAEVARLGAQIAEALDRAHRAGVVHRDLKPGNVMLTRAGVKLMDFGLARTAPSGSGPGPGAPTTAPTQSPTVAQPLTAEGSIVGTFQYMAPEQLEGREADARADLWALGCVLYEMATGRRAFEGATQASLVSAIMRDTPRPMSELAPLSPPGLERLVGALLAKDPDDRVQTAHDARLQLEWATEGGSGTRTGSGIVPGRPRRTRRETLLWSVAGLATALALGSWLVPLPRGPVATAGRMRLLVPGPPGGQMLAAPAAAALSPDGRTLAFAAMDSSGTSRLWIRPLDGLTPRPLPGTEHGDMPFWAPDARAIGFFADGKLKIVRLDGGAPEALCDAPDPRGGAWGRAGAIVFAPFAAGPLFSVPEGGGEVAEVLRPDTTRLESSLRFPQFLPDGRSFLFVALPRKPGGFQSYLGRLGSRERRPVVRSMAAPVYAEPGWLVTSEGQRLVALRFDPRSGRASGRPVPLADSPRPGGHDGTRMVSASRTGVLAYPARRHSDTRLVWLDREGRVQGTLPLAAGRWEDVSIAPDGRRAIVVRRSGPGERELWLVDLATGQASRTGIRSSADSPQPKWSPDGARVVFASSPRGPVDLFVQAVEGGAPELLYRSDHIFKNPYSWTPDGRSVIFEAPSGETGWDLYRVAVGTGGQPVPLVRSPFNEGGGWLSPDGRWLLYFGDETGANELFVVPFGRPGPRLNVPGTRTGLVTVQCWWSRDGREILASFGGDALRSIPVEPGPAELRVGPSRLLFAFGDDVVMLCPTPDHRRILAIVPVERNQPDATVIDVNWAAALKR